MTLCVSPTRFRRLSAINLSSQGQSLAHFVSFQIASMLSQHCLSTRQSGFGGFGGFHHFLIHFGWIRGGFGGFGHFSIHSGFYPPKHYPLAGKWISKKWISTEWFWPTESGESNEILKILQILSAVVTFPAPSTCCITGPTSLGSSHLVLLCLAG